MSLEIRARDWAGEPELVRVFSALWKEVKDGRKRGIKGRGDW